MAESSVEQKQDIVNILRFSSQYEMGIPENSKKIFAYIKSKGIMTSPIGKLYVQRIAKISTGTEAKNCMCMFCNKKKSVDGVICNDCMEKFSGGKLKIKASSGAPVKVTSGQQNPAKHDTQKSSPESGIAGKTIQNFAERVDRLAGGDGNVEIHVSDLFKDVFKHHTSDEAERIFICGTETTTPVMKDISSNWPAPWLYSRVGLWLLAAFIILEISWDLTANFNLLPGMMFIGSCIVPFSVMIFFFETNVPQNISIFRTVQVFFIGGCASLLSTLVIFMIIPVGDFSFIGAIMIGIVEETGKLLIVAWFIGKMRDCVYILNGMLIGSAVGAGFAVFESAGYAFRVLLSLGYEEMVNNINMRALLSPGGHVAWAAISGAAIMIALEDNKFTWDILKDKKFLRLFLIPIILHAIWDMPLGTKLVYPVLIVAVWIVLLVLIHNGLKEVEQPF